MERVVRQCRKEQGREEKAGSLSACHPTEGRDSLLQEIEIVTAVRQWLESFVIDLNLCPFAKRELVKDRIRFKLSRASSEQQLLIDLQSELELLDRDQSIETILLIHPEVLQDFDAYNQFLALADSLIEQLGFLGTYQLASFHPGYHFENTEVDDVENYTNRSPYPMLHVIREQSLERAIADYPDVAQIPVRNVELMRRLGKEELVAMMNQNQSQKQSNRS